MNNLKNKGPQKQFDKYFWEAQNKYDVFWDCHTHSWSMGNDPVAQGAHIIITRDSTPYVIPVTASTTDLSYWDAALQTMLTGVDIDPNHDGIMDGVDVNHDRVIDGVRLANGGVDCNGDGLADMVVKPDVAKEFTDSLADYNKCIAFLEKWGPIFNYANPL
jgi:hypothetical protein